MGGCVSTHNSANSLAPFAPLREEDISELFVVDVSNPINKGGKGCIYNCVEISSGQV